MSGRGLIGGLLLIFFISFILIYSAYFFLTLNYSPERSVNFAKFALGFLDEARAEANLTACSGGKAISTELMAKCMIKNSLFYMAENAFLKPIAQYFLDIWLVFKQAAAAHYPTYFMGGICDCGRWYYFPTLFLLKEPLPFLILFIAALAVFIYLLYARFAAAGKSDWKENLKENLPNVIRKNFAEFSMILFIIIYAASSMRSEVNLGYRHFMPVLPFLYILTASAWRGADFRYKKGLVFVLLGWYVAESFLAAPYFLPYFNQLGGGLKRGYDYAVDSNYDWGQDLGRLADWAGKNAVKGVSLSYFGTADPKYYLGSRVDIWRSEADNEIAKRNGWFAASVHLLKQYPEHYLWLDKIKDIDSPDYRAGASIFVYKL